MILVTGQALAISVASASKAASTTSTSAGSSASGWLGVLSVISLLTLGSASASTASDEPTSVLATSLSSTSDLARVGPGIIDLTVRFLLLPLVSVLGGVIIWSVSTWLLTSEWPAT